MLKALLRWLWPKSFLQNVYTAITTNTSKIKGLNHCTGMWETNMEPPNEVMAASTAAGNSIFQGTGILRTYCQPEVSVPQTEANLFVPITVAMGVCAGIRLNNDGICNKPPPPTAASIMPAKKASTHINSKSLMGRH